MKKYEKLLQFFDQIKTLGFWKRLFSWRPVQTLSYEAFEEYKSLISELASSDELLAGSANRVGLLTNDNEHLKAESAKLQSQLDILNTKFTSVETALGAHKSMLAARDEVIRQSEKKAMEQDLEIKTFKEKLTSSEANLSRAKADLASKEETVYQSNQKIIELQAGLNSINEKLISTEAALSRVEKNLASKEEALRQSEKKEADLQAEQKILKGNILTLQNQINAISEENVIFKNTEADRSQVYKAEVATLNTITGKVQAEREEEKQKNIDKELQRLAEMKETWSKHETRVQEAIKMICQKHTIEYVDQVPFKGKPDNTIQIGDEFIIFDAKSPSSDDLTNFKAYIKAQTESVKKYIKEANVRKEIFLVIPSNTVEIIDNFCFNMADYTVHVVTIDVLEPLILALRKIEDYEFVEQLTPEDRENICRIIGKFAHITKRKIQVDNFFTRELIGVLKKCEANLPADIFEKALEFEKSEKINPPIEKRSKQILIKDLETEEELVREGAKKLPLYEQQDDPHEKKGNSIPT